MARQSDGVLARFTRDLTADARDGRLEPVRCRTDEIARVIDILLRHGKNNPALVGPAGVGKTAIAEGLAQRLAAGDVPLSLRGTRILAVDGQPVPDVAAFRRAVAGKRPGDIVSLQLQFRNGTRSILNVRLPA